MFRPVHEQIEVLFNGNIYEWAVSIGAIQKGEALNYLKVFNITQQDVFSYLKDHSIPGLDCSIEQYQGIYDGPKWSYENGKYIIGWRERGVFEAEHIVEDKLEFKELWVKYLVQSLGLPA